jgi:hypothetical protein
VIKHPIFALGRHGEIVAVVLDRDGKWRVSVRGRDVGNFAGRAGAESFLVRVAAKCGGTTSAKIESRDG